MKLNKDSIAWPWATLAMLILVSAGFYTYNFYPYELSQDAGDWGAFGDFFGGIFNPIVSSMALYFLIKAYITQRDELAEAREALKTAAENSRASAEALRSQSINDKINLKIRLFSSQMNYLQREIDICQTEFERATAAINADRYTWTMDGRKIFSDQEINAYRKYLTSKIKQHLDKIQEITIDLGKISKSLDGI